MNQKPFLGYGLGLRPEYYQTILESLPAIDWFEILTENYMVEGGKPRYFLERIREHYPVVMHGVSLSIGGTDPLDRNYLRQLKQLVNDVQPQWVSDHLCWTGQGGQQLHDLMPLPYTEEAIAHLVDRIGQVQDYLGRQILLENVSSYLNYTHSSMQEWEFYSEIAQRADCLMLLDINNIYVSARNHNFNPVDYLQGVPGQRVWQYHLAGHSDYGDYVIDTHDQPVVDSVWDLYRTAVELHGPVSAMIERDDRFPPFEELLAEHAKLSEIGTALLSVPEQNKCLA